MARSKNLASYEEAYWDLLEAMRGNMPEIVLRLPRKQATNMQQTFYAFIRAHEHTSNAMLKRGEVDKAMPLVQDANVMRGYLVAVDHTLQPSTIRFINRDLNPDTADMREQIKKQLGKTNDSPPQAELPPVQQKDVVGSLFDKPLTLQETPSDDTGDNAEAKT